MQDMVALNLNSQNVCNCCLFEPREFAERQEILADCRFDEQPEAVVRDVLNRNG